MPRSRVSVREVALTVLGLAMTVLAGLGILAVAEGVSTAFGGSIEPAAIRTGTATGLACHRRAASLGLDWSCTGEVAWQGTWSYPSRVAEQRPPYEILASADLTGSAAPVTGHLPMGWESAGSWRGGFPVEVVVAVGHPVGSVLWWSVQVWSPLLVVAMLVGVALALHRALRAARIRRRAQRRRGDTPGR